jgi:hypothetical protein
MLKRVGCWQGEQQKARARGRSEGDKYQTEVLQLRKRENLRENQWRKT